MFKPYLSETEIKRLIELENQLPEGQQRRTPEQIEAIYSHGQNMLVSASAGSGKTFVMVERIIDMIERGVAIDQLFISTFTVKAATELKERLEKKLNLALEGAENSESQAHLSLQLANVQTADIGTMDAFTQKLVTRYGYLVGISPSFSILQDETEQSLLKDKVFGDLFEIYRLDERRAVHFNELIRNFTGRAKTNRTFRDVVYQLYNFMQATADPKRWLKEDFIDQSAYTVTSYYPNQALEKLQGELEQARRYYQARHQQVLQAVAQKELGQVSALVSDIAFKATVFGKKGDFLELAELMARYANIDVDQAQASRAELQAAKDNFLALCRRPATTTKTGKLDKLSTQIQALAKQEDYLISLIEQRELARFVDALDKIGIASTHLKKYQLENVINHYRFSDLTIDDVRASDLDIMKGQFDNLFYQIDETLSAMSDQIRKVKEDEFESTYFLMEEELHCHFDAWFTKKEWDSRFPKLTEYHQLYAMIAVIYQEQPKAIALLKTLQSFLSDFSDRYLALKITESRLEFSDIAHAAIRILTENEKLRQSFQDHYAEVMVDEYQDNSPIQERLLDLLSNGENRFMVGDVKQSIYRFRQADPTIFTEKFNLFKSDPQAGKLIVLKENFRSHKEVVDSVNVVFSHLMDQELGDIAYDKSQELVAGNPEKQVATPDYKTTFLLYDDRQEESLDDIEDDEANDRQELPQGQVDLVINEIKRLQGKTKEPFDFSSIALLVPSRTRNIAILKRFSEAGIPLISDDGVMNYLKSTEVMIMLETLRTINNPLNDYALVSLMKSPMFSFDEDDLARIAVQDQRQTLMNFYDKVLLANRKEGHHPDLITDQLAHKITQFLDYLISWRQFAKTHLIHELIWKIYNDRFYLDYVGALPNGLQRQTNLYSLALRAHQYEQSGFRGLSRFVTMIDHILEQDHDLADVAVALPKNAVRLMTIHKSKGLEFDYVFVLNMDQQFNLKEASHAKVIAQKKTGVGIIYQADLSDDERLGHNTSLPIKVTLETLPFQTNKEAVLMASLSERMRLLYVAMTRAVKKLYLVGTAHEQEKKQTDDAKEAVLPLGRREKIRSFQAWLLALADTYPNAFAQAIDLVYSSGNIQNLDVPPSLDVMDLANNRQSDDIVKALDNLKQVQTYNDLHQAGIQLPSLRTPSQLKKAKLIEQEQADIALISQVQEEKAPVSFTLPNFSDKKALSSAEVGSALHDLMQRLDLQANLSQETIKKTLLEMTDQTELVERLPLNKIEAFFKTELGQQILEHQDKLHREAPFAILTDDLASGEAFVIRGIIDGYLLFDDRIILFDYKTDKYRDASQMLERYQEQMYLYVKSLKQAYNIDQVEAILILFGGDNLELISVPQKN
ncbi:UvrD-helicase domain-containing protein [Streptococcus thoraltensis]|uniref:UvrD-helicase domain-containing protein n=1 Tax=Streptococcus thoraltensis TaxID=55085 RepID=UPI0003731B28|nr:UvrD-helicase domain-containing protein [Streptococcus thoraltensis]